MPKLIILEGPDSTGKSSLAKFLARKLDACYHHASGHRSLYEAMFEHHKNIVQATKVNLENGHNVVLDRHWPSELVYGGLFRVRYQAYYDFNKMLELLEPLDPQYAFCTSENGWDRYQETHKDHDRTVFRHLTKEEYYAVQSEYRLCFDNCPHVEYSIEKYGHDLNTFTERFA